MLVVDVCDVGALEESIALVTAPSTPPVIDGFLIAASIKPGIPPLKMLLVGIGGITGGGVTVGGTTGGGVTPGIGLPLPVGGVTGGVGAGVGVGSGVGVLGVLGIFGVAP